MNDIIRQVIESRMLGRRRDDEGNTLMRLDEAADTANWRKSLNEGEVAMPGNDRMSNEELKVESLKIATNIAKLMADVTPDDIIKISEKVSDFIRHYNMKEEKNGSAETTSEEKKEGETGGQADDVSNPITSGGNA